MAWTDLVYPKKCLECGVSGLYLCPGCVRKVKTGGWRGPTFSLWRYEGVIRKAILQLKYKFVTDLVDQLSDYASEAVVRKLGKENNVVLIPVPLHKSRLRERGFNQAQILGDAIARKVGWGIDENLVIRNLKTKPQVNTQNKSERMTNLTGAFSLNSKGKVLQGVKYIIFDDVVTTGTTISEIEKVLVGSGVTEIDSLTIACS